MRRSQRLKEKHIFGLEDRSNLLPDNLNTNNSNQNQKDNCTVPNDIGSVQSNNSHYSSEPPVVGIMWKKTDKTKRYSIHNFEGKVEQPKKVLDKKIGNEAQTNNSTLKKTSTKVRSTNCPKTGSNKRRRQPKGNTKCKRRRLTAEASNGDMKAPIISIDNYLNPLRHPLLHVETNIPQMENVNELKYCNNIQKIDIKPNTDSLLPQIYPMHFSNQNFAACPPQMFGVSMPNTNVQHKSHFPTPELTQSLDFESSTSTISMPESLREVFGCEDIREVLKMDKVIFRMRILHLQTLSFVLNIQYEYLYALVEKIMQLDTETLQKVVYTYKPLVDAINTPNC